MLKTALATSAAILAMTAAASAQDYDGKLKAAVASFAAPNSLAGVTLNVACRHLPAMDFIESHKAIFEEQTGAKLSFTDYPENDLRSHVVADASN